MRKNIVLIDFENVQPESLAALDQEDHRILVFVGATQKKLPFELAAAMQRLGERADYIRIAGSGPNALDFHIAYYIGQLSAQDPTACFHIISNDTGFDPLIKHLKAKKISVLRSPVLKPIQVPQSKPKPASPKTSADARARQFMASVCRPKATKPGSEKTLASAIASFYQKKLSDQEVSAIVAAMRKAGFIKLADGKINYAVADFAP